MQTIDPTTGSPIQRYTPHDADELERRLAAAASAQPAWGGRTDLPARIEVVRSLGELLLQRRDALAGLMTREMGKPIRQARAEVEKCARLCAHYAERAADVLVPTPITTDAVESYVVHEPLGAVLGIMPWNFPLWQAIRAAVPALLAGNVFLLKHAENVLGSADACEALFRDAGAPEGVFQVVRAVVADVGGLIDDERVHGVTFTGSTRAGAKVASRAGAAIKPVVLELGGSDPFVVLADADVDRALDVAMTSRFGNNGQSCIAAKRWIVEAPIYDRFVRLAAERIEALECDDPAFESTEVGPLARADLREALADQVTRSRFGGARVVLGGETIGERGFFYQPTLLAEVSPGVAAFDEETFGPVASVSMAGDAEHAIALANATTFGLGATVWTSSERAAEFTSRIQAGTVTVNGLMKSDPRMPFGGIKRSGVGRELADDGLLAFTNRKSVWIGV